jgi:hypothetical protein
VASEIRALRQDTAEQLAAEPDDDPETWSDAAEDGDHEEPSKH